MRIVFTIVLIFFAQQLLAQKLNGLVFDKATKKPVPDAQVTIGLFKVNTAADGSFMMSNVQPGDKLEISHSGYETSHLTLGINHDDPLIIWLYQNAISFKESTIRKTRNYGYNGTAKGVVRNLKNP